MRIIVDADACPNLKEIETIGNQYQLETIFFCDDSHDLNSIYAQVKQVGRGYQNVDMVIVNHLKEDDILITQDYGLATIGLTKKVKVINPNGLIYTSDNIDSLLMSRHQAILLRKKGHTTGPKKRTKEMEDLFLNQLIKLIEGI